MYLQKRKKDDIMNTKFKSLTFDHIPIHSSTRSPIHSFMQNKPNFKTSRIEYQESCIENMQNEPNFYIQATDQTRKQCKFYPKLLQLFNRQMRTFAQQMKKIRNFCKFLKVTHLTPYISMAYINIYPDIPFTRGVYPQLVWREKNAKQTQFPI
jgi:phage portal protein BeeE